MTFILAHAAHLTLLVNLPKGLKQVGYIVPKLLHGCGQALIESYDIKEGTITHAPLNCTLLLAATDCFVELWDNA